VLAILKWVIFDKKNAQISDLTHVKIINAKGITLRGEIININKMEVVI